MDLISRKDAKAAGLKHYFTGKPCKREHLCERYSCNAVCVSCATDEAGRAKGRGSCQRWYERNKTPQRERALQWRRLNLEQARLSAKEWQTNNPEKVYFWKQKNLSRYRAHAAARRARKLHATPAWADLDAIRQIYLNCPEGHHVDHIVPLQGNNVCGLHVADNLQYLTASDNIKKGNKF